MAALHTATQEEVIGELQSLLAEFRNLSTMPTRHMRVPYLRDRVADYRRALTGAHREIFTLSDDES